MIASPLNYTGGKYKLLPQLLPLFPQEVHTFVDLFCGGCNVGVNASARQVVYNDVDQNLLELYAAFRDAGSEAVLPLVYEIIEEYGLSLVSRHGYAYYHCDGSGGLAEYNREKFLTLRAELNRRLREGPRDLRFYAMFYVVIVYAFNNQIRYNSRGEYNLPVGKRDFNRQMEQKLTAFICRLQAQDCRFVRGDFRAFDASALTERDFVYADPPYLITCATYNEQGGWTEEDERALLEFLDELDRRHIPFALSNVLRSKGRENHILLDWLRGHSARYRVIPLRYDYSNSSYHTRDRFSGSEEVLIVNYRPTSEVTKMTDDIAYRSFCWGLGTTSFRTQNFNYAIERQLALLDAFWSRPEYQGLPWRAVQSAYYDFLRENGFLTGSAARKDKDARQKTSGLADIGLIHEDSHRLTQAGRALLDISRSGDFSSDNFLDIPRDSFLYLKQLLKTSVPVGDARVRPFLILLHLLHRFQRLSLEEYTYLLPLCVDSQSTQQIAAGIARLRDGDETLSVDGIIVQRLMSMENYQAALRKFLARPVDEALIREIGMNRKSRSYDRPYLPLYRHLRGAYLHGDDRAIAAAYDDTRKIKIGVWWRRYLFDVNSARAIRAAPRNHLRPTVFDGAATEEQFKRAFFQIMHLFKAKATLHDYQDLNRRYMSTADVLLFADGEVKLDVVPRHFFGRVDEELYALAFTSCPDLPLDCPLTDISPCLSADPDALIRDVNAELGTHAATTAELREVLADLRYRRLARLIDEKFTDEKLIRLLRDFKDRNDGEIQAMVTDNADIPTIFEYVLGILWYKVSRREGRILDYMKLSLDADLLPKTHAAGGEADIVYEYAAGAAYPAHALLIEATLADPANQRRMEMEPVSRHLGRHLLRTGNLRSYCVFATNDLDINVTSDFRSRKAIPFYDTQDHTRSVPGMKIIPIVLDELELLLRQHITYDRLYPLFEAAYRSELPPHQWYDACIKAPLEAEP